MIKERIIQVLRYKKLNKENFFKEIGMTSANFRGNAKNSPLNSDAIENILSVLPDVNPEWLLTGHGEMLRNIQIIENVSGNGIVGNNVNGGGINDVSIVEGLINTIKKQNDHIESLLRIIEKKQYEK